MSSFRVTLTQQAQEDIVCLDATLQIRILDKLEWMGVNADLLRHQALRGDEWRGCFRYRMGDYRIIYQADMRAKSLVVLRVGHRREVYL